MKKFLLTAAFATLAIGSANAQIYDNYADQLYDRMSDNGQFMTGSNNYSGVAILNRFTGQRYDIYDPNLNDIYSAWAVTNDGWVTGYGGDGPCYWLNGKQYNLPRPEGTNGHSGTAFDITEDHKYIVGSVGTNISFGGDGILTVPAIWTLQADGSYQYEILPYDAKDFSNRRPQFVSANAVSEDGKTVIVQYCDFSGTIKYPALYKRGDDGKWTYKTYGANVFWDEEKIAQLPEMPVDPSPEIPVATSYFTKADTIAYNKAAEEYSDILDQLNQGLLTDWSLLPTYPQFWMYITDRRDEWVADSLAYEAKCKKYLEDADYYFTHLYAAFSGQGLVLNQFRLSKNGKYLAVGYANTKEKATYPAYFDLTSDKFEPIIIKKNNDAIPSSIADDGTMVYISPALSYIRQSYVYNVNKDDEPLNFYDYIAARDEKAAAFLKENYTFNVITGDDSDDDTGLQANKKQFVKTQNIQPQDITIVPDSLLTGTVVGNSDNTVFSSFLREYFSNEYYNDVDHTYTIDLNKGAISSINAVKADDEANGAVVAREYYSINGQRLGQLPIKGVYLEKVITTTGVKTLKRVK